MGGCMISGAGEVESRGRRDTFTKSELDNCARWRDRLEEILLYSLQEASRRTTT